MNHFDGGLLFRNKISQGSIKDVDNDVYFSHLLRSPMDLFVAFRSLSCFFTALTNFFSCLLILAIYNFFWSNFFQKMVQNWYTSSPTTIFYTKTKWKKKCYLLKDPLFEVERTVNDARSWYSWVSRWCFLGYLA